VDKPRVRISNVGGLVEVTMDDYQVTFERSKRGLHLRTVIRTGAQVYDPNENDILPETLRVMREAASKALPNCSEQKTARIKTEPGLTPIH